MQLKFATVQCPECRTSLGQWLQWGGIHLFQVGAKSLGYDSQVLLQGFVVVTVARRRLIRGRRLHPFLARSLCFQQPSLCFWLQYLPVSGDFAHASAPG